MDTQASDEAGKKDNLYTISESGIKANSMKDLKEVDYLRLK